MNIKEIAKLMTRNEFEQRIYGDIKGDKSIDTVFNMCGDRISCPHNLGIVDKGATGEGCAFKENCYKCWINAVKDIKFKGEDKMNFSKKDLKNGMVVELMDGSKRMVLDGKLIDDNGYIGLNHYHENLTVKNGEIITGSDDINKVYRTNGEYFGNIFDKLTLIWERGEEEKMKKEKEYTFKEVIDNIKDGEEYQCTNSALIISVKNNGGDIIIKHNFQINKLIGIKEDAKFKLKRKKRKVPFMVAVKEYRANTKTIKCVWKGNTYTYEWDDDGLINIQNDLPISATEILEGRWYVIEND